ncbi:MAG: Nitroreductase family protein [Smithella sp. PtaU1.Bin162]|nr:MAG: Nitroreductase family protein [Smithella sp. PtaU1.Bin162]
MDFFQALESRSSMRAFLPREVERELLEKIFHAVRKSPSYMDTQPWEVYVVTGRKKEELSAELLQTAEQNVPARPDFPFPKVWPEALEARATANRLKRFAFQGIDTADKAKIRASYLRNFVFFDAPCCIFVGLDQVLTPWSMFDLGVFVHGLLLALHAEGLGGCPQALVTAYPDIIRRHLNIPDNIKIALCVSLGYPDPAATINQYRALRKDVRDFVHWCG